MKEVTSLREFRQDTEFEMLGQFVYAGGSINDGLSGKIIFKKDKRADRLELEIYGELVDPQVENDSLEDFNKYHKIIGFTNNGFTVIIERAVKRKSLQNFPGIPYTRYNLGRCLFLNINYDRSFDKVSNELSDIGIDNMVALNCQYSFSGIDEWIDKSKVIYTRKDRVCKYEVALNKVKEENYLVEEENLKFSSGIEIKTFNKGFTEEYYWSLESIKGEELSVKSIVDNLNIFKELLEIVITVPIDFSYFKLRIPIKQMDDNIVTGYLVSSRLNIGNYRKSNTDIPYTKIEENFESILCNWYKKRTKLTLITQNFIINKYAHQYNQSVLLNSIKSLEMYHRNFIQEKETQKNENLEIDKNILLNFIENNIENKKHKDRFIENVNYNPEISLKKRIKALFDKLDNDIKNMLVKNKKGSTRRNIDKLAQKLANTRNYYTHGDPDTDSSFIIKEPIEIIETTLLLNQVIKYFVCKELFELDDEIIDIIIKGMSGVIK